jgi:hypothetical protein
MDILPYLVPYLQNLHPAVIVRGGRTEDEPLMVSLPTGAGVPNSAAIKAAALKAVIDARWDIVSVYIENNDLESLYMMAVPPTGHVPGDGDHEGQTQQESSSPQNTGMDSATSASTSRHNTEPLAAPEQTQATDQAGEQPISPAQSATAASGRPTSPLAPPQSQSPEVGQPTGSDDAGVEHTHTYTSTQGHTRTYEPQQEQGRTLAEATTREDG